MSLSSYSIRRPVFAWILMFGLIFFGGLSFTRMGINDAPDVDFPRIQVEYSYDGATPEVIEKDVIEEVESVLVSMEGIRYIGSTADRGNARIEIEFEISRNIDFALQETQTLLGRAQRNLPDGVDPPVVTKQNASEEPLMYINLRTDNLSDRELMILFRDFVRDRLSTVEGVAEIQALGYHEPLLRIDLDASLLAKYQLTATDVLNSIQREHRELPAGNLEYKDSEKTLRIMGEAVEVEEFKNMVISRRGGAPNFVDLRLKDVANVYEGIENLRRISRYNGRKAMAIAINKQSGVNAVASADRVKERIAQINKDLPEGTEVGINFDRTQFIRESVQELIFTLLLSAILTSLICWLFLGSWSATFNILLAIPTAIIGTFIFINFFGFTLNNFSLLGLALSIGVVVDDAIIMLENIARYMQMGWDRINASFKGAREITFAVIATTAALVAIFIPITFLDSIEGRFFFEFAVTIAVAVSLSSLEALTLAPMRCSQFLRLEERTTRFGQYFESSMNGLRNMYRKSLAWSLQHRWLPIGLSIVLLAVSLLSLNGISKEFAPAQDRGVIFTIFIAPDGSSLEYTSNKVKEFEELAKNHPAVDRMFFAVGGFGQGGQSNRGNGVVILKDRDQRELSQFQAADQLRKQAESITGLKIFLRDRFGGVFSGRRGSPLEFTINGPDPEKQKEYYALMEQQMQKSGKMVGIRSDDTLTLPEVHIIPNRKKAIARGVEVGEIADIINTTFGGKVAGQYTDRSRRFDIWVQLKADNRQLETDISKVFVRNNRDELLPLKEVVDIVQTLGPQQVYRQDRIRGIRVDSELAPGVILGDAVNEVRQIADQILPQDYFIRFTETPDSKLAETLMIMILGLVIAYMVLAIQFNSFMDPFIVYLAVPFGLSGAFVGLYLGGQTLNVYSVIGILLTLGIVKKNSILLVEFTNQLRDQGKDLNTALLEACPTRLRPILMTTTATLAAAIPPALALGPGAETRIPMALTVLGGVSISTVFTLYLVPAVYSLINPKRRVSMEENHSSTVPTHSIGGIQ
jgi:multidrug efflux pump